MEKTVATKAANNFLLNMAERSVSSGILAPAPPIINARTAPKIYPARESINEQLFSLEKNIKLQI